MKNKKKSNINVAIKVRPLIDKELIKKEFDIIKTEKNLVVNLKRSFLILLIQNMNVKRKPNQMFIIVLENKDTLLIMFSLMKLFQKLMLTLLKNLLIHFLKAIMDVYLLMEQQALVKHILCWVIQKNLDFVIFL